MYNRLLPKKTHDGTVLMLLLGIMHMCHRCTEHVATVKHKDLCVTL